MKSNLQPSKLNLKQRTQPYRFKSHASSPMSSFKYQQISRRARYYFGKNFKTTFDKD